MFAEAPIGDPHLHKVVRRLETADRLPEGLRREYRDMALEDRVHARGYSVPPPVPNGDPKILTYHHLASLDVMNIGDVVAAANNWGDKKDDESIPGSVVLYSYGDPIARFSQTEEGEVSLDIVESPVHEPQTPERFEKFYNAVASKQKIRELEEKANVPSTVKPRHTVDVFVADFNPTIARPSDIDRLKQTAHLR